MAQYLAIDILIRGLVQSDDIWMRKIVPLPFTPLLGMRLKLSVQSDDEVYEHEITLESIHYSFAENQWIEEQEDSDAYNALREGAEYKEIVYRNSVNFFENLGFSRLHFPQGQVIRHANQLAFT